MALCCETCGKGYSDCTCVISADKKAIHSDVARARAYAQKEVARKAREERIAGKQITIYLPLGYVRYLKDCSRTTGVSLSALVREKIMTFGANPGFASLSYEHDVKTSLTVTLPLWLIERLHKQAKAYKKSLSRIIAEEMAL